MRNRDIHQETELGTDMAKAKINKGSAKDEDPAVGKVRSARGLLMAALALAAMSLGGGFALARFAYQSDAQSFEPDYVDATEAKSNYDEETASKDTKKGDGGKDGDAEAGEMGQEGLIEFEDIMTDITTYDVQGPAGKAFLKLSVVLVYRPEPGARELVIERQPFMRDLFTTYVRSLTEPEIRGAAGLLTIKSELLKRARAATGNNLPQDVLIRELIVQ